MPRRIRGSPREIGITSFHQRIARHVNPTTDDPPLSMAASSIVRVTAFMSEAKPVAGACGASGGEYGGALAAASKTADRDMPNEREAR